MLSFFMGQVVFVTDAGRKPDTHCKDKDLYSMNKNDDQKQMPISFKEKKPGLLCLKVLSVKPDTK